MTLVCPYTKCKHNSNGYGDENVCCFNQGPEGGYATRLVFRPSLLGRILGCGGLVCTQFKKR